MIFLQTEPYYVISLKEILWGGTLMAITMAIHGYGMLVVLRVNHALKSRFTNRKDLAAGLFPIILASFMILMVHLIEVMVWGMFFIWKGAFENRSLSFYFSLNEYTTVGSKFNLPLQWRLLEGLISTTGLLAFAWSTGVLITLAKEFQEQRMEIYRRRRLKRISGSNPEPNPEAEKSG